MSNLFLLATAFPATRATIDWMRALNCILTESWEMIFEEILSLATCELIDNTKG